MTTARRAGDTVAAIILWILAAILWWQSTTWPPAADTAVSPTVMPRVLAAIMALVGFVLVLRHRPDPEEADDSGNHRPFDTLVAVGATIALAFLLDPLGLVPAGVVYVLVLQRLVGAPWRVAVPFALATPIAIWLIFVTGLHVPLPSGEIWSFLRP